MFPNVEFGWADKVAHVLHEQQIEINGIETQLKQGQATLHHGGVEVAGPAGGDRHNGDAYRLEPFGIELGGHVPFQHGHPQVGSEVGERSFQKGGLAGAGTAHQIEAQQIPGPEMRLVVLRLVLIGCEQIEAEGVLERHVHDWRGVGLSECLKLQWTQVQLLHHCGNRCCGSAVLGR